MAKANQLSAAFCRNTKESGMHADGNGLFLTVSKTGAKSWLLRLRWNGKRPEIGLGPFADVSLSEARERAVEVRKLARQGTDPRSWRQRRTGRGSGVPTFDECVPHVMRAVAPALRNAKHIAQWESTLKTYASPVIGAMPVDQIDVEHVEKVLAPIWTTKNETASRVRGRIERVLAWAIVKGHRRPPNPATWRGNLDMLFSKPSKTKKQRHHPALPYADLPAFMRKLRAKGSLTAQALALTVLTTSRTQEVIGAQWQEFDLEGAIWTIPAERMKAHREHRVPLVPAVLEVLERIPRIEGSPYVFPGLRNPHMSQMAMLMFLKRDMARPDLTVHGFRSTFKDWSVEETAFPGELSEAQLAHVIANKAQAAYERGDKLERRRELLQAWTDFALSKSK